MKRVPPWLVFGVVAAAAAGLRLSGLVDVGPRHRALEIAGLVVAALAVGVGITSVRALLAFDGDNPVTSGPFRFSRHPMYLAMLGIVAAAGLLTAEWVVLGAVPLLMIALDRLVVAPEEAELNAVFGDRYRAYCERVRRWL